MTRRTRAFTLLEVMAVVLILGGLFVVMASVFSGIADVTTTADHSVVTRRGLLLLDRVADDLAGATLVEKPEEVDPLEHPWLFLAESRGGRGGSNRLKFDSRSARPAGEHASDLGVVAYWTEPGDADDLQLLRWTSPALPEGLDRDFPRSSDGAAQVLARGVTRFAVSFVDDEGQVAQSWTRPRSNARGSSRSRPRSRSRSPMPAHPTASASSRGGSCCRSGRSTSRRPSAARAATRTRTTKTTRGTKNA